MIEAVTTGVGGPSLPVPPYRGIGTILLGLSAPAIAVGILLQFYPSRRGCTSGVFGYCYSTGTIYPYAGVGVLLLALGVLALAIGMVFFVWTPAAIGPATPVQYVPVAVYPPVTVYPAGGAGQVYVQVQPTVAPAPRVFMTCRVCGSVFDLAAGRCDRCGTPWA